jgi:hypothetical protein
MGRPGSALDNAAIEAWHSTLTFELLELEHFTTKAQVGFPSYRGDIALRRSDGTEVSEVR